MTMGRGRAENLKVSMLMVSLIFHIATSAAVFDISEILDAYPEFSLLNQLLTLTEVANEINSNTGLTLFAPPNSELSNFQADIPNSLMADILRHHVATEYFDFTDLQSLSSDLSVRTLLQTTDVIIISKNELGTVINNVLNTTVVSTITLVEKEISILRIDQVLRPLSFSSPPPSSSEEAPKPFNISRTLATLEDFNVFARYLEETGVESLFEGRQGTETGCTIFAPTDAAFESLPGNWFQKFSKNDQRLFLEYHSLNSFFSLGDLWELVEFPVGTIASSLTSVGSFILHVNSTNGDVKIRGGKSNIATITSTLYQSDPVIMFAIDRVLRPRDLFGDHFAFAPSSDPPMESPAPSDLSPAVTDPSPPPGYRPRGPHSNSPPQAPAPKISGGGRATNTAFVWATSWMAFLLLRSCP